MTKKQKTILLTLSPLHLVTLSFLLAAGPASLPTDQAIPQPILDQIYQRELGDSYKSADAQKYFQANQLIEQFFASSSQRTETVRSLEHLNLDVNIIGRLTRVRMTWPQLAGGVYYINERVGPHDVRYYLGIPKDYDRTKSWPLVIKLPTADAFVTEPRPDAIRVNEIYTAWTSDELKRHPDAVVIMPLLNLDELWGPSYPGMNNVIQPILHVVGRVNIDPARVYMVGHSMSAHATWNLALHYTTYFAAFEALAGGASQDWQRVRSMNLRNVLPVVWQDTDDQVIPYEPTLQLVNLLRNLKVEVDYRQTQHVGHVPTDAIAEERYQKMRARVRPLYPKRVSIQSNRPDTMFNRNDWVQIYQPIGTGQERHMLFSHGSGYMVLYPNLFNIDASINQNKITVSSSNIASMRFYLNDQMIDFSRAVSVVLNRRPRFEAFVQPSIAEMLKDQLFLGRGWRYYSAIIDLDFTETPNRSTTRPSARSGR